MCYGDLPCCPSPIISVIVILVLGIARVLGFELAVGHAAEFFDIAVSVSVVLVMALLSVSVVVYLYRMLRSENDQVTALGKRVEQLEANKEH